MPDSYSIVSATYREIPRFVGYRFSADGRVETRYRGGRLGNQWVELKGSIQKNGRLRVDLRMPGQQKARHYFLHCLILEAFAGPAPPGTQACHFPDRNLLNNRIDNLRWDTPKANQKDRIIHGTDARGEKNHQAKLSEEEVVRMRTMRNQGTKIKDLAQRFKVSQSLVVHICTGRSWKHAEGPITRLLTRKHRSN
jgi:hypothetical protein